MISTTSPICGSELTSPGGRVVWNWEGREYTKYFLPPNLRNSEFTPFSLDCEMHYAGVEAVLLHTDPSLVRDSSYLQEIVERLPGRMYAMAPVEEWRIIGGDRRGHRRDKFAPSRSTGSTPSSSSLRCAT